VRILFDQGVPVPLRASLTRHEVATAYEKGWSKLKNGELLDAAEQDGFDQLVTTDAHLKHQQNLRRRKVAIVVLTSTSWPRIRQALLPVIDAIDGAEAGSYTEIKIP